MKTKPAWTILDCTLRDGGYYTNWDFSQKLVKNYLEAVSSLPVSIVELGYRADEEKGYLGAYYYLPRYLLEWARSVVPDGPDFAVMLNAKDCKPAGIPRLLADCRGLVRLVRMAVAPATVDAALELSAAIKQEGFEVALNLMYLSQKYEKAAVFERIAKRSDLVDYVALVDSYGACYPSEVAEHTRLAKQILPMPVGFHGHDNMTLAFANSIAALGAGGDMVDATITGMGRGAGNLRTEVIAGYYASERGEMADYMGAIHCIDTFDAMKREYGWGAQLPYVVAGFNSLPQAQVMDWLAHDRYSTAAIVGALRRSGASGSAGGAIAPVQPVAGGGKSCVIVGGGPSVEAHELAIEKFAEVMGAPLVFSSSRHLEKFRASKAQRHLCLVGDEHAKLDLAQLESDARLAGIWVDSQSYLGLPESSPLRARLFDAGAVAPLERVEDAVLGRACPCGVAIAGAVASGFTQLYLVGFDGYNKTTAKAKALTAETQGVLDRAAKELSGVSIVTLTPSAYAVPHRSIYSLLASPRDA